MPNWKRIIVGDAFSLPSRDINYYRDLFLLWPFLIFSIAGLIHVFTPDHMHRVLGMKCLALAALSLALARERLILFLGSLGFCGLRLLLASFITHDWRAIVGLLAVGVLFLGSIRFLADYQPSYKWPDGHSIASLFVNLSGLILTLVAFSSPWLQP